MPVLLVRHLVKRGICSIKVLTTPLQKPHRPLTSEPPLLGNNLGTDAVRRRVKKLVEAAGIEGAAGCDLA